jgi:hypothetical protein
MEPRSQTYLHSLHQWVQNRQYWKDLRWVRWESGRVRDFTQGFDTAGSGLSLN